ncbi:NAD(P)-dependent dehydrogenase (short-subunit alcohol dehydrogenase family) [Rhizobium pisi]|uniref:NAD(P)-dependent dehydrogenase (Short-subunit alcohol dehydrogenase family) n=1 Tax=Rhizobium pisi TaxID=574561 RepID=A0A7W5G1E6_9HYPH|nr:NAD(P)-dependent dehydrogenase (short-subunit alcohol dehydrogenase family) [Rhizobium pisi]
MLNVNLISTALLARALLPELEAAEGLIVNVTSIAGSRVHPFAGVAYAASKAGLASLTRELAHEFGPRGVRANADAATIAHPSPSGVIVIGPSGAVKVMIAKTARPGRTLANVFLLRLVEIKAVRDPCLKQSLSLTQSRGFASRLLKHVRHVSFPAQSLLEAKTRRSCQFR